MTTPRECNGSVSALVAVAGVPVVGVNEIVFAENARTLHVWLNLADGRRALWVGTVGNVPGRTLPAQIMDSW